MMAVNAWAGDQVAGPSIGSDTTNTGPRFVASTQVPTDKGIVEGKTSADSKIRALLGIPYAAPPVGDLRWKAPLTRGPPGKDSLASHPVRAPPMQGHNIWDDMIFATRVPARIA